MTVEKTGTILDTGARSASWCLVYLFIRGLILNQFVGGMNLGLFAGNPTRVAMGIFFLIFGLFVLTSLAWRIIHRIRPKYNERLAFLWSLIAILVFEIFFI